MTETIQNEFNAWFNKNGSNKNTIPIIAISDGWNIYSEITTGN